MSEATVLVGHRYIVGTKEYAVIRLANGEKRLGRILGWADAIGLPCEADGARYLVAECGRTELTKQVMLVDIPPDAPRPAPAPRRATRR